MEILLSGLSPSTKFSYRVFLGKHNLLEEESGSKAIVPEKIVVHEKWNQILVALGYEKHHCTVPNQNCLPFIICSETCCKRAPRLRSVLFISFQHIQAIVIFSTLKYAASPLQGMR